MPYRRPHRRPCATGASLPSGGDGLTDGQKKKRIDKRLTPAQVKMPDLRSLFNEVLVEVQDADDSSLKLEAKLRIKLRAIEIGLRVFSCRSPEQQRNQEMSRHEAGSRRLEKHRARRAAAGTEIPHDPVAFAESLGIMLRPITRDLLNTQRTSASSSTAHASPENRPLSLSVPFITPSQFWLTYCLSSPDAAAVWRALQQDHQMLIGSLARWQQRRQLGHHVAPEEPEPHRVAPRGQEPTIRGFSANLCADREAAGFQTSFITLFDPCSPLRGAADRSQHAARHEQGHILARVEPEPDWKRVKVTADECPRISKGI